MAVYKGKPEVASKVAAVTGKHGAVVDAFTRACYEGTQRQLREAGVKELVLYRGVKKAPVSGTPGTITLNPLSSFTTDYNTAASFAKAGGHIMAIRVPADRVFSTYSSGFGCRGEHGVVVLGGQYKPEKVIKRPREVVASSVASDFWE